MYPYDDPKNFDSDITHVWKAGSTDLAIGRLKRLLRCILLRRAKDIVDLPKRTDNVITLTFSNDEYLHYEAVKSRVVRDIDTALDHGGHSSQATYLGVLQLINELRLICNLGIRRNSVPNKRPLESTLGAWNSKNAQKAFEALATAGPLSCTQCRVDLDTAEVEEMLGTELPSTPFGVHLYECLRVFCSACFQQAHGVSCGHNPPCARAAVSHVFSKSRSNASSPSKIDGELDEIPLSTKVNALVSDLVTLPSKTKR